MAQKSRFLRGRFFDDFSLIRQNPFKNQLKILTNDFDYIICDTPPWKLFVDAKIISSLFDNKIYLFEN